MLDLQIRVFGELGGEINGKWQKIDLKAILCNILPKKFNKIQALTLSWEGLLGKIPLKTCIFTVSGPVSPPI